MAGRLGKAAGVVGKLGLLGTAASAVAAGGAAVVSWWAGPDGKLGEGLEDAMRTPAEATARATVLAGFEGFWSKIEQFLKAIVVATGGKFGGGLMNYTRNMQGLEPIGRTSDGNIDLNQIKTIYHGKDASGGTTPPAGGEPESDTPAGNAETPVSEASMGGLGLAGLGLYGAKSAYDARNTSTSLMDRALKADAAGDAAKSEKLFGRAAERELAEAVKHTPRIGGRFGKAAAVFATLATIGVADAALADEAPKAPENDAPVSQPLADGASGATVASVPETVVQVSQTESHGFWYNAFQTAASFGTGVVSGVASIPEGLYDGVDSLTGDRLWGDANTNSTSDAVYAGAKGIGVDIDNHQTAAAFGEVASMAVPVAGVAGAVAKGSRVVRAVEVAEKASDSVGSIQLTSSIARGFVPGI